MMGLLGSGLQKKQRGGSGNLFETNDIRAQIEHDYEDASEGDEEEMSLNSGNSSQDYPALLN